MVTIIPPDNETIREKKKIPITKNYQDVKEIKVKFTGKTTVEAESEGIRKNFFMLTEREDIKPLLGMDWPGNFNCTMRHIGKTATLTNQSETDETFTKFQKLFKTNRTIKDTEIKIQLQPVHQRMKQKARPIPYLIQNYLAKKTNNLIENGHLEKIQKLEEYCVISPAVITVKKDKSKMSKRKKSKMRSTKEN